MALIGSIVINVKAKITQFQKGLKKVRRQLQRFNKDAGRAVGQMGRMAGAAAAMAGVYAVKEAEMFNRAMLKGSAIMKGSTENMDKMRQTAKQVASQIPATAAEVAEGYFFLASAGYDAERAMAALPQVAAFATAGNFDLALATDLVTDAQSALGLSSQDAAENYRNLVRVTDVLVKANTLANASTEQFSLALTTKAGAAAKSLGMEIEEMVAILAAYADQGVKAEQAGTAITSVLITMQSEARKNKAAWQSLGVSVFDQFGEFRNMGKIIDELGEAMKDMSDEAKSATLENLGFAKKMQGFVLPLLGTGKKIQEYQEHLKSAGGTTRDVASKMMTPLQKALAQLNVAFVDLGDALAPVALKVVDFVKEMSIQVRTLLKTGLGPIMDIVGNAIMLGWVKVKSILSSVGGAMVGFFKGVFESITDIAAAGVSSIQKSIEGLGKGLGAVGKATKAAILALAPGGESPAEAFSRVMQDSLIDSMKTPSFTVNAEQLGANIIDSMAKGFASGQGKFKDELETAEKRLKDSVAKWDTIYQRERDAVMKNMIAPEAPFGPGAGKMFGGLLAGAKHVASMARGGGYVPQKEGYGMGVLTFGPMMAVIRQGMGGMAENLRKRLTSIATAPGAGAAVRGSQEALSAIARRERGGDRQAKDIRKTADNTSAMVRLLERLEGRPDPVLAARFP